MLGVELLILGCPHAVSSGIAPAVEKIAPLAGVAARAGGRLSNGRAMVDDPDFRKLVNADENLVKRRNVFNRVEVGPVRSARRIARVVEIDPLRMVGDYPVIRLRVVVVLDQVIPDPPFPDDRIGSRVHLDDLVRPELPVAQKARVTPGRDGLGFRFHLPGDHEDIAVGQVLDIMVETGGGIRKGVGPGDGRIRIEHLHDPAGPTGRKGRIPRVSGSEQTSVFQQIGTQPRTVGAVPGVSDGAVQIDQVGCLGLHRRKERITGIGARLVDKEPGGLAGRRVGPRSGRRPVGDNRCRPVVRRGKTGHVAEIDGHAPGRDPR